MEESFGWITSLQKACFDSYNSSMICKILQHIAAVMKINDVVQANSDRCKAWWATATSCDHQHYRVQSWWENASKDDEWV